MYWIKRLLQAFILFTLTVWIVLQLIEFIRWLDSAKPLVEKQSSETRSKVHWLSPERPLIYTFNTAQTASIRVLSNAIFKNAEYLQTANYAIEYTLFDENQQVISRSTYHHTAKLARDEHQQQVKQIIEERQSLAVSTGQSFYLNHSQFKNASSVAFKLIEEDSALQGVVVRIHGKQKNNPQDIDTVWLKYPLAWRARISNYHTLGPNALSEQEITNAVQFDWKKLAPQGVPNVDFQMDTLYETLPYNIRSYDFSGSQLNLDAFFTNAHLSASIEVEYQQDMFVSTMSPDALSFTWYDSNQLHPPKALQLIKTDQANLYKLPQVARGLVTINSSTAVISQWFDETMQPVDPLHSQYYQVSESDALHYRVNQGSDIKLDVRPSTATQINIDVFDKHDALIEKVNAPLTYQSSQYDRILNEDTERSVIASSELLFIRNLPDDTAYIKVTGNGAMNVKLQARLATYQYQTTLCDDVCEPHNGFMHIPAWYPQQANNDYEFAAHGKVTKVRLFKAPPLNEIKETYYTSKDLIDTLPISNTALVKAPKRYYLPTPPLQTFHYRALIGNSDTDTLLTLDSARKDQHSLIIKNPTQPFVQELDLSKKLQVHSEVQNKDKQIFINSGASRPWAKQRVFKLNGNTPLKLSFDKQPLSVTIKVYSQVGEHQPIELFSQLSAKFENRLNQQYSIQTKRIQIHPSTIAEAFMLHPTIGELNTYPSMTLLIGSDISQLNSLILQSNKDIWLSIVEEHLEQPKKVNWWLNEES